MSPFLMPNFRNYIIWMWATLQIFADTRQITKKDNEGKLDSKLP